MTAAEMQEKRESTLSRAKQLRSVPGSGYHDNDPTGPIKMREPAIDEHVIAFKGTFETVLVGECATRVLAVMQAYFAKHGARLAESRLDIDERTWIETAKEYAEASLKDGSLMIRNGQWNAVLAVLSLEGVGVTCTG